MEAARILAAVGAKPKRTIRFILWGGEEQGLLGSAEYTKRYRSELDKVSAVFNHDTGTNWAHSLTVTEAMYDHFAAVLEPVMDLTPPEAEYDGPVFKLSKTKTMSGGFGGSDHASFLSKGVPAWSWGLRGHTQYGYGWHSQWDHYDIVVPEYQKHTATVIAMAALGVANLPELLPREGVRRQGEGGGDRLGSAWPIAPATSTGSRSTDELKITKVLVARAPAARAGMPARRATCSPRCGMRPARIAPSTSTCAWRENREEDVVEFSRRSVGDQSHEAGRSTWPIGRRPGRPSSTIRCPQIPVGRLGQPGNPQRDPASREAKWLTTSAPLRTFVAKGVWRAAAAGLNPRVCHPGGSPP